MSLRKTSRRRWERLRVFIFRRDKYLCQPCLKLNRLTEVTPRTGEIDHILPIDKGGKDDPDNLQATCIDCHKDKTFRELTGKGCDVDGFPQHWKS